MKSITNKFFLIITVAMFFVGIGMLSGCKKDDPENTTQSHTEGADLVVYGKIFTAENNAIAEAFAVKDGKFVYVGDRAGVESFINEGVTKVINHTDGIVIPGCYEGHAHYIMANAINLMDGPILTMEDDVPSFYEKVKAAYQRAKTAGKSCIYGFGWFYQQFEYEGMPTRAALDSICPDIALFVSDAEGHKGLANSKCLRNAGIIDANDNVLITKIRGGEICMDANGKPDGLLKEQAGTYVRNKGIDFNEIFSLTAAIHALELSQEMLLKNGYVSYMDGWSNYYGTNAFYEAAKALDDDGRLNMLLGLSYEFESSCADVDAEIAKAFQMKSYTKGHINADYVKIFIDGTVESGTGLTTQPYMSDPNSYGIANWEENEVTDITRKANAKGLTMHVHTMGDGAVHRAVNAFVSAGNNELRNTVVHARNVLDDDFQRMADNNIVAVSGMLWHVMDDESNRFLEDILPINIHGKAYPMKSFFKHGVVMTSHCDYPATSGSPTDPFGIMKIAVTGQVISVMNGQLTSPWWSAELISREQALQALTINGAYQMHVEHERGSIKVGKYADFVLADKDVLECPQQDIHTTKVVSTWFEGQKVYPR